MDKLKESLGLHINSDGPVEGKYIRARGANFVLKAPPVGTPHFTNWDAGLTSLQNTTKERFESRIATRFLDDYMSTISDQKIRFGAKDIKIVDNLAAISYPRFTDINKSTSVLTGSKVLSYLAGTKVNSYDYTCIEWAEVNNEYVILPQFDLTTLMSPYAGYPSSSDRFTPAFDGMYIVLEYNGYYTKKNVDPCVGAADYYDSTIDGKRQVLTYNPEFASMEPGEFTVVDFAPGGDTANVKPVLMARIGHTLDIGATEYFSTTTTVAGDTVYGFGNIQCDVYVVKYKPVIECGKVDLYTKKRGSISSYLSNGKLVSAKHNLKNGDIIKISDALNSVINGVRYVQVVDSSTFIIYSDSDFTTRVDSEFTGAPVWTACGNVYDEESQAWDYFGTLTSPEGRNGYVYERTETHDIATFYKTETIGDQFNGLETMDELLQADFGISSSVFSNYKQFPVVSGVPTRSTANDAIFSALNFRETNLKANDNFSPLDTYWTNCNNYLQSFRFGESIDLIKQGSKYVLAVGEPGLESIPDLNSPLQLPVSPVYGKVFLFDIYMTGDQISDPSDDPDRPVSFNSKYYAHTEDSEIDEPPYLTPGDDLGGFYRDESDFLNSSSFSYYYGSITHTTGGFVDADSIATKKADRFFDYCNQEMFGDPDLYRRIEYKTKMEYWYGAMVYHLADLLRAGGEDAGPIDPVGLDYTVGGCREAYFSDLTVPKFLPNTSVVYSNPPTYYHRASFNVYPYVDNFGKAVALSLDGSDLYLISSSTVKPIVERPDYDGSDLPTVSMSLEPEVCENDEINKTQCGYIHVFKNGLKTQKIYEDGYTLPSGGWRGFYYKSEKFASHIVVSGDELVFGQPKPIDYHTVASTAIETSKIFIYKRISGQYYKVNTIENENNLTFSFVNTISFPDQKEFFLRDGNEAIVIANGSLTSYDLNNKRYHPSDRFGAYFKYNGNILACNAFDVYNESGEYHGSNNDIYTTRSNEFNRPIDYLHVYEKRGSSWDFVTKIAPAFDRYDEDFEYESLLGPNVYNSIRALGNINYSNTNSNSRTWDIDLTGAFDLVNDRILMKDPLSYSVFQRVVNPNTSTFANNLTLDKYFTYDEKYEAEETIAGSCNLVFDRVSAIHKYDNYLDDYRNLYCENSYSSRSINYRAPIYFVNIPVSSENIVNFNSIRLTLEEVRSVDAGVNLKLVLFKKDPRTTVYPFYSNLCASTPTLDANKQWSSNESFTTTTYLKGGVFDSSNYSDVSSGSTFIDCSGSSCMATLISASSITVTGSRRDYTFIIDNNNVDINDYITTDDLILSSTRSVGSENIVFDDLSNIGYDTGVSVESSLIIGFIYQPMNYKMDSEFSARADVRVVDITFEGQSALGSTPTSDLDYTFSCVYNKVASLDYYRTYYNSPVNKATVSEVEGKLIHINPALGVGVVPTSSYNDNRGGQLGAFSKGYEVLSVDNYGTTPETSVFNNIRSLDVQYLESLPLYLQGVETIPYINLFLKTNEGADNSFNLYLNNTASSGNLSLYTRPYAASSGNQNMLLNASYFDSGNLNSIIVGGPASNLSLFMKVPTPSSGLVNLNIKAYGSDSGNFSLYTTTVSNSVLPLYMKSRDVESLSTNTNLFVYGNTVSSSFDAGNIPLYLSVFDDARQTIVEDFSLFVSGPSTYIQDQANNFPMYIGKIVGSGNNDISLRALGGFGGSPTDESINFSLKNTGVLQSGNMTLVMPMKGFNNSDTIGGQVSLFLNQNQSSGNLPLFIDPSTAVSSNFNLYMPSGNGVLSSEIDVFIRGYNT